MQSQLFRVFPNIESASLVDWGRGTSSETTDFCEWKNLTHLDIRDTHFEGIPKFPETLKHLNVDRIPDLAPAGFRNLPKDYFYLPQLEYLSMVKSSFAASLNDIAEAGLASGTLRTLILGCSSNFREDDDPYRAWPASMPAPSANLEALSLSELYELSESTILAFLRQYPNLKWLDLRYTAITGSTLRELFERENKPQFIDVSHCESCHHDAVEAARAAGIVIRQMQAPRKKR